MGVVIRAYSLLVALALIPALPILLLFARARARFGERLGAWRLPAGAGLRQTLWFHGASVGEINGLLPIIERARTRYPGAQILVTATSLTGLAKAQGHADILRLLPLDSVLFLAAATRGLKISSFVFGETELWPALIWYLDRRRVPIFMVNARISDYTFARYRLAAPLLELVLGRIRRVFASTARSAERFEQLGVPAARVETCGNTKFDRMPAVRSAEEASGARARFFDGTRPVLTLASLRPGEDEVWFPVLVRCADLPVDVAIVPRHPEKFDFFAERLRALSIPYVRASSGARASASLGLRVALIDEMGVLEQVYSFSDAAFIGATLVDIGGHNPLEAAAYGVAPAVGPYQANITELTDALREADALTEIDTSKGAEVFLREVAVGSAALRGKGMRAREVWRGFQGGVDRIIAALSAELGEHSA